MDYESIRKLDLIDHAYCRLDDPSLIFICGGQDPDMCRTRSAFVLDLK